MKRISLPRMCLCAWLGVLVVSLGVGTPAGAGEIGFSEDFATGDRDKALEQLIPGTEESYFYQSLHAQNRGELSKVEELLKAWVQKHGRTARVVEVENRQALLRYPSDPQGTLKFLRERLGVKLDHQREVLGEVPKLPTSLEAARISREVYTRQALDRHGGTTDGFEDRALEWASGLGLDPDRRRHLLSRLSRPDVSGLVELIVADLEYKGSRGFGSLGIHRQLLRSQLDDLVRRKPELLQEGNYVQTYLVRLWPSADEDWRHDPKAREAYLERLWSFVSRLNESHNSLKAHVLYHRLVHDRSEGTYDRDRLLTYLKLPRAVGYAQEYVRRANLGRYAANLGADYRGATQLESVGNEEPLVRSYLEHFFVAEEDTREYERYLDDTYVKHLFAETKIVGGIGDMDRWYAMLPPARYQALKERVDLDFAPTNPEQFAVEEQVGLDVWVKGVETLIVKVFEINALSYYLAEGRELDTSIDLDGLVANEETTYRYEEPALRRVKRHFEFPELKKRGTYVIDFIGGGKASRAVVRKGDLHFLSRTSVAGAVLTVLDESKRALSDASVWLGGREYKADDQGMIVVPYTNRPGQEKVILVEGEFARLESFQHESESYRLEAGIHVEREALLSRETAEVVVRPSLTLNGEPVTVEVLQDVKLVITSQDREGVETTQEVGDFAIADGKESAYEFQVPANLTSIAFTLRARVEVVSQSRKEDLADGRQITLNGIDGTERIDDVHLSRASGGYFLEVLGKTGESREHRPVHLTVKHRDFRDPIDAVLQSDAKGRVELGALEGIEWVRGTLPEGTQHTWPMEEDHNSFTGSVHGVAGERVRVPTMGSAARPERSAMSLLELRAGAYVEDRFGSMSIRDGYVVMEDLRAGDYELYLKEEGKSFLVRLVEGERREGYAVSGYRQLELSPSSPLQISSVRSDGDALEVTLQGWTKLVRVHVAAARYVPEYTAWDSLDVVTPPDRYVVLLPGVESQYVVGRDIGDELRYILERKYSKRYPGNFLERPSLLLNPWDIRSTQTGTQEARAGEAFGAAAPATRPAAGRGGRGEDKKAGAVAAGAFSNLDFLAEPAVLVANLEPGEDGVVRIERSKLGVHHDVRVVAVSPTETVSRRVPLDETPRKVRDLRLILGLDSKKHFTEKKEVTVVTKGESLVIEDVTTSDFEPYDTLAKVYALLETLSGNSTLVEFGFITRWPELTEAEKLQQYSKYACHELHLFLYEKDPEFFAKVVKPYLQHKVDPTFLDDWLLGRDLSGYLEPWAFGRLNAVERILLARRIAGERPAMARHTRELLALVPPDAERFDHLFKTALRTSALEAEPSEFAKAKGAEVEQRKLQANRLLAELQVAAEAPAVPTEDDAATELGRATRARRSLERAEKTAELKDEAANGIALGGVLQAGLLKKRAEVRQLYQKLEKTKEWVENHYYRLPIEEQNASLITVNAFWSDFAAHEGGAFYSPHVAETAGSFAEMMLALAVLDLPFEAGEHTTEVDQARFTLKAASPLVVYHKEIREAERSAESTPILVTQNFYRFGERYLEVDGEKVDKFIRDEFLVHVVYGCHVVITNPASSRQKLEVLLQIPRGSLPVNGGQYTRSVHVDLEPYRTWTADYFFYFPAAGTYEHFPVHVAKSEELVAYSEPMALKVVESPTTVDTTSWEYVSQNGSQEEVLRYLEGHNLFQVNLEKIAWRMRDGAFFKQTLDLLGKRHVYNGTLWAYGLVHDSTDAVGEYLKHSDGFLNQCGAYLRSKLVTVDPVERRLYQHREYWPLVNARAHRLGARRTILNDRFYDQYQQFLTVMCYRAELDDEDLLELTYYLLLQDRVEEGLETFGKVKADRLPAKLQYDYFEAYLGMYTENLRRSRETATRYAEYPVERWREFFAAVVSQLDEIEGKAPSVVDEESRAQRQGQLAATEPSFEVELEGGKVTLTYQNLESCRVSYYVMDIELLFSRNPFVGEYSGQFAYIRPNATATIALDEGKDRHEFRLPEDLRTQNVLVEVEAAGKKKSQTYYSGAMAVAVVESYAQVRVTHSETRKPLSAVYVKVYARMKDGQVRFYKDGYTDLRGIFDYGSLSTNELDFADRFALLFLSDEHGAVVREAAPPKQ